MASSKWELPGFECDSTLDTPVVMRGVEGVNYIRARLKVKDASEVFIGFIGVFTTSTRTLDKGGDLGTNCVGQVLDTDWNKAQLRANNPGVVLTSALFFAADAIVDVLINIGGTVSKVKVAENNALELGSKMGMYTGGDTKLWAATAGAIIGKAMGSVATGTGAQYLGMAWVI